MTSRSAERGTVTLWLLGLCVCVLFLGGISLDLWRAFGARRALAEMADAAALAGASGLDEDALRAGELRLDPGDAERLARRNLASREPPDALEEVRIRADADRVEVAATGSVELSLLRIFLGGEELEVAVSASADPRRSS